jgi:CysZ protein
MAAVLHLGEGSAKGLSAKPPIDRIPFHPFPLKGASALMAERYSLLDFPRGFFLVFRGARLLLRNPRLLKYIIIPFLINVAVFSLSIFFGLHFFQDVVTRLLPQGDAWYWAVVFYAFWTVAVLVTLVLVFFSFTVVGNLIASPFNELLSERTEELLLGKSTEEPFALGAFFRDMGRVWLVEIRKMAVFVLAMAALLLLNLLPLVGSLLYGFLSILLTLFFLAWEYLGFVHERKRHTFREQRQYLMLRKGLVLGFAAGVLLMLAIPFMQLFCIPVAVVGATLLWCEEHDASSLRTTQSRSGGPGSSVAPGGSAPTGPSAGEGF